MKEEKNLSLIILLANHVKKIHSLSFMKILLYDED